MLPKWQQFLLRQACAFWGAVVTYQRKLNANARAVLYPQEATALCVAYSAISVNPCKWTPC